MLQGVQLKGVPQAIAAMQNLSRATQIRGTRIGLNAAHDQRLKRRAEPLDEVREPADLQDSFLVSELSSALQEALNQVEDDYRVAVVLYDVLGCSYTEIAELTDVAEGTVKSRIFRGRSRLAELLGTRTAEE